MSGASCGHLFERIRYPSLPFAYAFDPFLQDYPLVPRGLEDYPLLDEGLEDYAPSERELDVFPVFYNAKKRSSKKYASAVYSAESASPGDYSAESASPVKYSAESVSPFQYSAQPASSVDHSELSRNLEQYLGPAWSLVDKLTFVFLFEHQLIIILC